MSVFGRDYEDANFGVDWIESPVGRWKGSWIERGFDDLKKAEAWYNEIIARPGHIAAIYEHGLYEEVPGVEREGLFYFNANGFFEEPILEDMKRGLGILWFNEQESTGLVKYEPKLRSA